RRAAPNTPSRRGLHSSRMWLQSSHVPVSCHIKYPICTSQWSLISYVCCFVPSRREFRRIPGGNQMLKRFLTVSLCLFVITLSAAEQAKKPAAKKATAGPAPDKAYLQKIWDGWSTLDPANTAKFYATGPNTFFDIAPLKYSSWEEYEKGVK